MPTVIYVDVLLFINTIITYAVLITAEKLFKRDTKLIRLIAAAFFGSLFSLTVFIGIKSFFFSLLIKVVSSVTVSLIAFPFISRREFIRTTLAIIGVSVGYSGCFILFYRIFKPSNMAIINDIVYFEFNPLILLSCTALIYILMTVFHKLFYERIKNTIVRLEFTVGGADHSCLGKVDTGCDLTEPFSRSPVIIIDSAIFSIGEHAQKRIIPYSALNRSSILYAVKADRVLIDGAVIGKEIYLAVSDLHHPDFQAIINSEILR